VQPAFNTPSCAEYFEGIVPLAGLPGPQPVVCQRAEHGHGIGPCQHGIEFGHPGGETRRQCCLTAALQGDGRHDDAGTAVILYLGDGFSQDEGSQLIYEIEGMYEALDVGRHGQGIDIKDGMAYRVLGDVDIFAGESFAAWAFEATVRAGLPRIGLGPSPELTGHPASAGPLGPGFGARIGKVAAVAVPRRSFDVKEAKVHGTAPTRPRQLARGGRGSALGLPVSPGAPHEPSAVWNELKVPLSELAAVVYDTENSMDEKSIEVRLIHRRVVAIGYGYRRLLQADHLLFFQAVEKATGCGLLLLP